VVRKSASHSHLRPNLETHSRQSDPASDFSELMQLSPGTDHGSRRHTSLTRLTFFLHHPQRERTGPGLGDWVAKQTDSTGTRTHHQQPPSWPEPKSKQQSERDAKFPTNRVLSRPRGKKKDLSTITRRLKETERSKQKEMSHRHNTT
jgi:hypothetical protein